MAGNVGKETDQSGRRDSDRGCRPQVCSWLRGRGGSSLLLLSSTSVPHMLSAPLLVGVLVLGRVTQVFFRIGPVPGQPITVICCRLPPVLEAMEDLSLTSVALQVPGPPCFSLLCSRTQLLSNQGHPLRPARPLFACQFNTMRSQSSQEEAQLLI